MTDRARGSHRARDIALSLVTVAVLVAFAAVLLVAPKSSAPDPVAVSTSTTPQATSVEAPSSPAVVAGRSIPEVGPTPTVEYIPPCSQVTPSTRALECVNLQGYRTVYLGNEITPVTVRDLDISVQAVDILPSRRPGYGQVRIQGALSLTGPALQIPRNQYYLSIGKHRYSPTATGTGLVVKELGRAYSFSMAFELSKSALAATAHFGPPVRLVVAPTGIGINSRGPVGMVTINLVAAARR